MNWLREIFSAENGQLSSKRICGFIGFIICSAVLIYCTIKVVQAPNLADVFLITCSSLLGIDSITSIWKSDGKEKQVDEIE